jgi:hypothetical protein
MPAERLLVVREHVAPQARKPVPLNVCDAEKGKMVPEGGFEPPTRGFSIRCSTN